MIEKKVIKCWYGDGQSVKLLQTKENIPDRLARDIRTMCGYEVRISTGDIEWTIQFHEKALADERFDCEVESLEFEAVMGFSL